MILTFFTQAKPIQQHLFFLCTCFKMKVLKLFLLLSDLFSTVSRGQILGRNPDKSHKSFLPCYSQSPLQLCLEISISSHSHNLLRISTVQFLRTVKEKGVKPDRKPRNPFRNLNSENSQDYALNKIVRSWIRLAAKVTEIRTGNPEGYMCRCYFKNSYFIIS
jgi:hypothetical protein